MSLWNKDNYYLGICMASAMHNADSIYTKPIPYSWGHAFSWQTICKYYSVDNTKLEVASVSKQRWKMYLPRLPNAWNPRHLERDIWMLKNQHDDIQSPSKHAATARRLVS